MQADVDWAISCASSNSTSCPVLVCDGRMRLARAAGHYGKERPEDFHSWGALAHARSRSPYVAVLLHAGVAALLALTGTFAKLAVLASVAMVFVYLLICVSAHLRFSLDPGSLRQRSRSSAALCPLAADTGGTWRCRSYPSSDAIYLRRIDGRWSHCRRGGCAVRHSPAGTRVS